MIVTGIGNLCLPAVTSCLCGDQSNSQKVPSQHHRSYIKGNIRQNSVRSISVAVDQIYFDPLAKLSPRPPIHLAISLPH